MRLPTAMAAIIKSGISAGSVCDNPLLNRISGSAARMSKVKIQEKISIGAIAVSRFRVSCATNTQTVATTKYA